VSHLFISPGHNYVGHHGQPAVEYQAVAVDQVECEVNGFLTKEMLHDADYQASMIRGLMAGSAAATGRARRRE
jgi:hypothetical protein